MANELYLIPNGETHDGDVWVPGGEYTRLDAVSEEPWPGTESYIGESADGVITYEFDDGPLGVRRAVYVEVQVRARSEVLPGLALYVELVIDGISRGAYLVEDLPPGAFSVFTAHLEDWDGAWTHAELGSLQVRLTRDSGGKQGRVDVSALRCRAEYVRRIGRDRLAGGTDSLVGGIWS